MLNMYRFSQEGMKHMMVTSHATLQWVEYMPYACYWKIAWNRQADTRMMYYVYSCGDSQSNKLH